jgi:aminoglycoside-2''-adenylyltransferase
MQCTPSPDKSWKSLQPRDGARWLSALTVPWWVAGGWAIDLSAGDQSRPHKDLDIGILRRDALSVIAALSSWEFHEAKGGVLSRLRDGHAPGVEVNSLWCRPTGATEWFLELMLDESDGNRWVFRRDHQIQRPLRTAIRHNSEGIPYLAPEIQLLYKARAMRAEDQADFDLITPRLDADACAWLRQSLAKTDPSHAWLQMLNLAAGTPRITH